MPSVETDLHQKYLSQGFTALVIHVGNQLFYAGQISEEANLTFPMVMDLDGSILDLYSRAGENVALFPLGYLIDKNGVVQEVYTNDEPNDEALVTRIEELLAQ